MRHIAGRCFPLVCYAPPRIHARGYAVVSKTSGLAVRRADHWFFAAMAALVIAMVSIGFAHTYYLAGLVRAPLPSPLVHVHAIAFSCWVLFLLTQVILASCGWMRWHMRLGNLGMILAALLVVIGFATLVAAIRRHAAPGMSTEALLADDTLQLSAFAVLAGCAFWWRRNGPAHKRLILLATASLMGPALSRWPWDFVFSSALVFYAILNSFSILLIAYDLSTRHRIHAATAFGALLLGTMQAAMETLGHAGFWSRLALWIQQ